MDSGAKESPERFEAFDRGPLPLKAAFRAWSDPQALSHLDEFDHYSGPLMLFFVGGETPDPHLEGSLEWGRRFEPMRKRFEAKLTSGELVATGFATPLQPDSRRREIPTALYEVLELDYEASEAVGPDLKFIRVEVSLPVRQERLSHKETANATASSPGVGSAQIFTCNENYTRVSIRGRDFFLAGGLCTVVSLLHEASKTADPWRNTKWLLEQARYNSMSLGAVFRRHTSPSWKELIEQRRGFCRLRL